MTVKRKTRRKTRKSTAVVRRRGRRGGMRGKGFLSFMKKANKWLRKTKLISKTGKALGSIGVPYAGKIGKVAGVVGYGKRRKVVRRRRRKGGALRLAGAGIGLAGGRYQKKHRGRGKTMPKFLASGY